ncbi:MAG: hypothetical protein KDI68_08315 [Gammaproteobacteria bacterium]|nr:hypothetical protein [Gammaproteobacteria bacterium]
MAVSIQLQNGFIVGGTPDARVTPNFRLREYLDANGGVRVHRELAAAVQILRERLGAAITIIATSGAVPTVADPGLALRVSAKEMEPLAREAAKLQQQGYFERVEPEDAQLYLQLPDPATLPSIAPALAFDCGVRVTAAFETSGDPFQQVTGNFDGAGLSFGPIQCNLKSGTLQELFRRMRGEDPERLARCFDDPEHYAAFWKLLDGSRSAAVRWADQLSTGRGKQGFAQPWKGYLQRVGSEPLFQRCMRSYAYDKYGKLLMATLAFTASLSPVRITNLRCLAALYDMGVQQGSLHKAHRQIIRRVASEQPADQFALTRILVEERAKKAAKRWRADCLSRRLSILEREPVSVSLDGERSRRGNPKVYLLRDCSVRGLESYLAG